MGKPLALALALLLAACDDGGLSALLPRPARDFWPASLTPPDGSLDTICRQLHGGAARWSACGEVVVCLGDPQEPPLLFQGGRLRNTDPVAAELCPCCPWTKPPLSVQNLAVLPGRGRLVRVSGLVTNDSGRVFNRAVVMALGPGGAEVKSRCLKEGVSPTEPWRPGEARALECLVSGSWLLTGPGGQQRLALAASVGFEGEDAHHYRLRVSPFLVETPPLVGSVVLVSPGRAYREISRGKLSGGFALEAYQAARVTELTEGWWVLAPLGDNPPGAVWYLSVAGDRGKARVAHLLKSYAPPPPELPADLRFLYDPGLPAPGSFARCPGFDRGFTPVAARAVALDVWGPKERFAALEVTFEDGTHRLDWLPLGPGPGLGGCVPPLGE